MIAAGVVGHCGCRLRLFAIAYLVGSMKAMSAAAFDVKAFAGSHTAGTAEMLSAT